MKQRLEDTGARMEVLYDKIRAGQVSGTYSAHSIIYCSVRRQRNVVTDYTELRV